MRRLGMWCLMAPLFFAGCIVSGVSIMDQSEVPKNDMGYLYGRFRMENGGNVSLQLVLTNVKKGLQYRIPLERSSFFGEAKGDIYAFPLEPGEYRLTHIAAVISSNGRIHEQLSHFTDECYSRNIVVEAGSKQYLADFTGTVERKIFTASWGLSRITDNFEDTTNKLDALYEGLRDLPARRLFDCAPSAVGSSGAL